ncbi:hypothetical protein ACIQMR_15405 [Streptomyces sp. NPDC091376]|uniref:hypothetical protein n=1 Tax=Streptomyces sp. NPDC091376 TaxID=3365994 RepID=UPI00382CFBC6
MDLESVADELYGLPPEDFTDARRRHAAAARASGDRGLATRIMSLRRPTLSAWACNLLVRADPDQAAGLLRLGEGLRQAHQELDRDQMRELGSRRNRLVGALSRRVRDLAAEAGHPVSESVRREVEDTLQAVLADPDAAAEWATAQLVRPLSPPVGFTEAALAAAARRPAPATPATAPEAPAARGDGREPRKTPETREPRRARDARKAQEKELARARQDAETAEQRAREREEALREAESEHERAEALLEQAEERAAALAEDVRTAEDRLRAARRELDEARAEESTARTGRDGARKRVSETRRAAGQARRNARSAGDRVEALEAERG